MALPQQTSRKEMIARLRGLGFTGPEGGGDHDFMVRGKLKVRVPNPHGGTPLHISGLRRTLRNAGISDDEWMGAL